ncbi:MAG: ADP-forming succinate--CoA ligase subunit beta [Actinobacteria bacterium]|nr:ADP-forming succinate--CoA ligase subunit beta [Actinomycetota bacterium]
MDLFEYQGKQLFARYDIPVSPGEAVTTVDAAVAAADRIGYPVVVKAQVQVGGRGKAGGIKIAANADEARAHATAILGMDIKGHTVRTLWIEQASDIADEHYASFTLDRAAKLHLGMLSAKGGMDIEAVAVEDPDAIARLHVDPVDGLTEGRCREWVRSAQLDETAHDGVVDILLELYRAYTDGDADLVEINPLVVLQDGRVHALDAKVSLDSNAAFRHPEWEDYEATQELDAREREAREKGLQYIGLDGSVGVICNGAGMTMATLDVVTEVGGSAANFLDVGGGAGADVLANAIEVVNNDPGVRSILINIFGGITKCDEVALGVVEALERVDLRSPIVIRLDGTNAAEGRTILNERASEQLIPQPTMLDAARKAVEIAGVAA